MNLLFFPPSLFSFHFFLESQQQQQQTFLFTYKYYCRHFFYFFKNLYLPLLPPPPTVNLKFLYRIHLLNQLIIIIIIMMMMMIIILYILTFFFPFDLNFLMDFYSHASLKKIPEFLFVFLNSRRRALDVSFSKQNKTAAIVCIYFIAIYRRKFQLRNACKIPT